MSVDILAIGDLTVDQIFGPLRDLPAWGREAEVETMDVRLGGNTGNFALAGKVLNLDVACLGPVGNDDHGFWIKNEMEISGLNTDLLDFRPNSSTSVTTALVREDGERLFITLPGALTELGETLQQSSYPSAKIALFSGWCQPPRIPTETLLGAFTRLRASGTKVAIDLAWSDASWGVRNDVLDVLSQVDFALMNSDEATAVSGETDLISAAEKISEKLAQSAVLVIKNGERGALVKERYKPCVTVPMVSIGEPAHAVGAGDCFNAGFFHAVVVQKLDAEAAAAFGCDFATLMLVQGREAIVDVSTVSSSRRQALLNKSGDPL
ncbi:carbohydrate kinase family protein [Agrobacterium rosae]|uniref:carbohydrate kinase family protein n=1 Tax=Agrobacterium rosae TaxID=1972867 RepID=UPI002034A578|nr:carbohydrate kinase family protein [Agrobacterium rosae]MCM2435802.1 carbohydrate kinase family protein [Agrobacterium rosae]